MCFTIHACNSKFIIMFVNVFSVILCVSICVISAQCQLEEGAQCTSASEGLVGKCVNPRRCLSTVNDIKTKKFPQICSFKGREAIICCTDCELVNDTSNVLIDNSGYHYFKTGQKATDKCLEYIVRLNYPCPMSEGVKRQLEELEEKCYVYRKPFIASAVGGYDALRGQFPHMALLGYGDSLDTAQWLCGASVISDRFVLTAGHCLSSNAVGTVKYVATGILKRTDPPQTWQRYTVRRAIHHPQYNPPSKYNDIALLEVETKIKFSADVLPACLNVDDKDVSSGLATGWGALGHRQALADTLQVVNLVQFTHEECAAAYPPHRLLANGYNRSTQACYGDKYNITDTCEGDSGGPIQVASRHGTCIYKVTGVTSYGRPCGYGGGAGMYTRVSHYIPWIESIVWP